MTILIAPNAFKGSLTALEAARAMRRGVLAALPKAKTILMPIADGGDGLMECLLAARGGRRVSVGIHGPLGERRRASYARLNDGSAVVEMAAASGLALVPPSRRDPLGASTFGTGELLLAALKAGARRLIVGLGGSASSDGGAGMAQALGARLLDARGHELSVGVAALRRLERVDARALKERLRGAAVLGVTDVVNPLLGPRGSARVYGPQKGATPAEVRLIERALTRYALALKRDLGVDVARKPGAGAAGGMGAGLMAFLGAELVPGTGFVLDACGARGKMRGADAAITGEGRLDATSFYGKAPIELARLAREMGVPTALVCGSLDQAVKRRLSRHKISAVVSFADVGATPRRSLTQAARWACQAAAAAVQALALGCVLIGVSAAAAPADYAAIDELYFRREEPGMLEQSLARLERLAAEDPRDASAAWRLGRSLVRSGERVPGKKERLAVYKKAEESLSRATALAPDDPEAHFWLGVALGRRGQVQGMLKSLFLVASIRREMETALKLDPHHGGAHHVLGELLWQLPGFAGGSRKQALKQYEMGLALAPRYAATYVPLAQAYLELGKKEKALEVLDKLAALKDPADPAEFPENLKDAAALRATTKTP